MLNLSMRLITDMEDLRLFVYKGCCVVVDLFNGGHWLYMDKENGDDAEVKE